MTSQEHEREGERERLNTLLLVQTLIPEGGLLLLIAVAVGMMKMATGDDSPLRQGAEMGSRLVFADKETLRRRKF